MARLLSLVILSLIGLFFLGSNEPQQFPEAMEIVGFLFFPIRILTGMLLSWRWEIGGSIVAIGSLIGFYLWYAIQSGRLPTGPWFIVFTSPAFLFLVAGYLNRLRRKDRDPK